MIHIDRRRATAPAPLTTGGQAHLPQIAVLVAQGKLTSECFKSEIYGCAEVKEALWRLQYFKCCYCEAEYEAKFSTVEHFRPKSRADRGSGTVDVGYWWLSYDFQNLYFACHGCNTPKRDYFPLIAGTKALAPGEHPDTHPESPLLLDPGRDKPEDHMSFEWIPHRGFHLTGHDERGKETIRTVDLNRDALKERRNKYYQGHILPVIRRFKDAKRRGDAELEQQSLRDARRLAQAKQQFALLARDAFRRAGML